MKILIVEDDLEIARQTGAALREAGYAVDTAHDGEDGHFLGETENYDAVILDLGLPKMSGLNVLESWRKNERTMPVLILSARDTWREKVIGLRTGADDYLAKPFELEELLARVEALVRRGAGQSNPVLECGRIKLDTTTQKVFLDNKTVSLTSMEYRLLSCFMHHPEAVLSKTVLSERLYEYDCDKDSNTIEVLVNKLRKKFGSDVIQTHRGRGYQLTAQE